MPQRKTKGWCSNCTKANKVCHVLKVRNPGVRPDPETLAFRVELYRQRASMELPLFEGVPWFSPVDLLASADPAAG